MYSRENLPQSHRLQWSSGYSSQRIGNLWWTGYMITVSADGLLINHRCIYFVLWIFIKSKYIFCLSESEVKIWLNNFVSSWGGLLVLRRREFHPGRKIDQGKRVIIVISEQVTLTHVTGWLLISWTLFCVCVCKSPPSSPPNPNLLWPDLQVYPGLIRSLFFCCTALFVESLYLAQIPGFVVSVLPPSILSSFFFLRIL